MRAWVTLSVLLVTFLVALEATVISTAMPRVVQDLGGHDYYSWAFSAYLGCVTVTGMIWGRLADRWGLRPGYLLSVAVFLVGSALCGAAQSMAGLILSRALQGIGGGGLTPLGQTVMATLYTREQRARLQGLTVAVYGLASVAGPVVGGYLVEKVHWRWVFYLNLPFGCLGWFLLALFCPGKNQSPENRFDFPGMLLFVGSLTSLLLLCGGTTWAAPLALVLGLLLARHQTKVDHPFLPLELSRVTYVRRSWLVLLTLGMGVFAGVSYLPLYFQELVGRNSQESGQLMLPLMASWVLSSGVAPSLALRWGSKAIVILGCLCQCLGYAGLAWLPPDPQTGSLAGIGIGLAGGLTFAPVILSVQASVPRHLLASATSLVTFLRMLGAALGTALLGLLLRPHLQSAMMLGWLVAILGLLASLAMSAEGEDSETDRTA